MTLCQTADWLLTVLSAPSACCLESTRANMCEGKALNTDHTNYTIDVHAMACQ